MPGSWQEKEMQNACSFARGCRTAFDMSSTCFRLFSYLIVPQLKPRLLPVGEDLPQDDSKAPNVAFRGEFPVHDALWGHPANGEHGVSSNLQGGDGIFVTNERLCG